MTKWAVSQGMIVTAAPYQSEAFWGELLKRVGSDGFSWWNLQLYGGADYSSWVSELGTADAESFLVPGWKIVTGSFTPYGCVDSPSALQQAVATIKKGASSLSGAFVWQFESTSKDGHTAVQYATAIADALKS